MTPPPPDRLLPPPPPPVPAVLRLVQLVLLGRWRATGEELYREVADLAEARAGTELLVSGCGEGVTAEWLASRTGAVVTGVDPDPVRIASAEQRLRQSPPAAAVTFEVAKLDYLPHEAAMLDAAGDETSIAAANDPQRALA